MVFGQALEAMKQGEKVKLPSWSGYWYWNKDEETIMMHTKDGEELEIREMINVEYTLKNVTRDDWEIATIANCLELMKKEYSGLLRRHLSLCGAMIKTLDWKTIQNILDKEKEKEYKTEYFNIWRAINNEQSK